MKFKELLKEEFINGKKPLDWAMLVVGLTLQIIGIIIGFTTGNPDSVGLIISGLTGVVSVVLCSQGKISFYVFGYIQLFTYVFCFALPQHLWGEFIENIMYAVSMVIGLVIWAKNYRRREEAKTIEIKAKKLGWKGNLITAAIFVVGTIGYWIFLKNVPMFGALDSQPFVDSVTSVPAYIAQFFMVFGFREQWIYWLILDIGSVILAARAGSIVLVCQFIFWVINCIYGFVLWHKSAVYEDYKKIN
jgi:nicotinamide mononucleotide transporter